MYCHIHHCHYHHCNCVPKDSKENGKALTQEELLAYTQEMKEELKDYTVDLKDQIFSYIDIGVNPVEIANTFASLKEQDNYILITLTNKIDELNNTTNLSMYNLRTRVTNLEGQSSTIISDLANRTQRIVELEDNLNSLPFEDGTLDDTFVTKTANGVGQIDRNQRDKNEEMLSVKDYGVKGDGVTDDTEALNIAFEKARLAGKTIYVPDGVYRTDDTVTMDDGGKVVFAKNAELRRVAEASSTEPVFVLRGRQTESIGGRFVTKKPCPKGILVLGHRDEFDTRNAVWWRCITPYVEGTKQPDDIGIRITSGQPNVGTSSANYFGYLDNPHINWVDNGLVIEEIANSHTIIAPHFYQCITSAITMYGAYANIVHSGFLHRSTNGVVGVKLMNRRRGTNHHSTFNRIRDFGIEPGGAASSAFYIEDGSINNVIDVIGNTAGSFYAGSEPWRNEYNVGSISRRSADKRHFTSSDVTGSDGSISTMMLDSYQLAVINNATENTTYDVAYASVGTKVGGLYEVIIGGRSPGIGFSVPTKYLFALYRGTNDIIEYTEFEAYTHSKNVATLSIVQDPENVSRAIFKVKIYNNGTGVTMPDPCFIMIKQQRLTNARGSSSSSWFGKVTVNEDFTVGP